MSHKLEDKTSPIPLSSPRAAGSSFSELFCDFCCDWHPQATLVSIPCRYEPPPPVPGAWRDSHTLKSLGSRLQGFHPPTKQRPRIWNELTAGCRP